MYTCKNVLSGILRVGWKEIALRKTTIQSSEGNDLSCLRNGHFVRVTSARKEGTMALETKTLEDSVKCCLVNTTGRKVSRRQEHQNDLEYLDADILAHEKKTGE